MSTLAIATPKRSAEPTDILRFLREHPLTTFGETILRVIAGMFYQQGICWAAQRTIAKAAGCGKSTVMRELDDLEALGLIRRIARNGTSHMIQLAHGLTEALREMRIKRREVALEKRGIPKITASFDPIALNAGAVSLPNPKRSTMSGRLEAEPSESKKREHRSSHVVRTTSGAKAPTEPGVSQPTSINLDISNQSSTSVHANARKSAMKVVSEKLVQEGVTPARARSFASLFDSKRILRNIQAGLHRAKDNPPGYLIAAITHDFAASRINPHSEAAVVRKFERQKSSEKARVDSQSSTTKNPILVTKSAPESLLEEHISQRFDSLSHEKQISYEDRAKEQLQATIGSIVKYGTGAAFHAMVKNRARVLFQRDSSRAHSVSTA